MPFFLVIGTYHCQQPIHTQEDSAGLAAVLLSMYATLREAYQRP